MWDGFSLLKILNREAQILDSPKFCLDDLANYSRTPYKVPPIKNFDTSMKSKLFMSERKVDSAASTNVTGGCGGGLFSG